MPLMQFYRQLPPEEKIQLRHAFVSPGFVLIVSQEVNRCKDNCTMMDLDDPDLINKYRQERRELAFWQEIMELITTSAKELTNA